MLSCKPTAGLYLTANVGAILFSLDSTSANNQLITAQAGWLTGQPQVIDCSLPDHTQHACPTHGLFGSPSVAHET